MGCTGRQQGYRRQSELTTPWEVEETGPTVTTIRIQCDVNQSWEQWALITSDRHLDNPKCDRKMIKRHLEQAKERNAFNIDLGDNFDAMQGRDDRRGMKKDVLRENQENDYFDSLVEAHAEFYEPYISQFAVQGTGNHESGVLAKKETDLTKRFVKALKEKGSPVVMGGYRGWVRLLFSGSGKKQYRQSMKLYYTHGGGGGGPVTKGVINTNRRAVYLPDADIVIGGHIHECWQVPITRARLSDAGVEYPDEQLHLAIPTYKEEFFGTGNGFHHQNERAPKPLGAWWLRFYYLPANKKINVEATRAK